MYGTLGEKDALDFLQGNLKSMLNFPDRLAFVSKTAFLSNVKSGQAKLKTMGAVATN
jgi:hypothetical protein